MSHSLVLLYPGLCKQAVDFHVGQPTKKYYGLSEKILFNPEERRNPDAAELRKWRAIAKYMALAAPEQLRDLKVLTGKANPDYLVQAVRERAKHDTTLEWLLGRRRNASNAYEQMTPLQVGQYDATYHPSANAVILNEASRAALIHEIGHAIDLSRAKDESNFNRWLRNALKPTLAAEVKAWNKGTDSLRSGFVMSKDVAKEKAKREIIEALQQARGKKYPALGSYFGGTLGAITGGVAGAASGIPFGALLGSTIGGGAGALAGIGGGKLMASMMKNRHATKEERLMAEAIANKQNSIAA